MPQAITSASYDLDVVCGGDGEIKARMLTVSWLSPDRVAVWECGVDGDSVILVPGRDRQLGRFGFWVSYESICAATNAAEQSGRAPRLDWED